MQVLRSMFIGIFLLCCLVSGLATHVQASDDNGPYDSVLGRLQNVVDAVVTDDTLSISGAVLRVKTSDDIWNLSSGLSDIGTGTKARPHDKFRCGSIIKPFLSAVILQLVEEGKLSLDARIVDLLPDQYTSGFQYADEITVEMLLNHTSGIGEWTEADLDALVLPDISKIWTVEELIALAVEQKEKFRPGEGYSYNNTEYNFLGLIIESLTGISWRENIEARIFSKTSLANTSLPRPGNRKISGDHMRGYREWNGQQLDMSEMDPSMADAAGGHALVSNTEDLSIFLEELLDAKFFADQETLALMQNFVPTDVPTEGSGYGLGLGKYLLLDGVVAYGHTGSTGGYSSVVIRVPTKDITISAAIAADNGPAIADMTGKALAIVIDSLEGQSNSANTQ